jgi:hypothetical protein
MDRIDRRAALAAAAATASIAVLGDGGPAASQTMDMGAGKDTTIAPGVVQRAYGETPAIIPGFKAVSMRDIILQPGSATPDNSMKNAMVCHITEGEMQIVQDGKEFAAKKNFVWTCNIGTREAARNSSNAVAVMRVTDLMPA